MISPTIFDDTSSEDSPLSSQSSSLSLDSIPPHLNFDSDRSSQHSHNSRSSTNSLRNNPELSDNSSQEDNSFSEGKQIINFLCISLTNVTIYRVKSRTN